MNLNTQHGKYIAFSMREAKTRFARDGVTLVRHEFTGLRMSCIWFA